MVAVPIDIQNRVAPDPLPRQRLQAADSRAGEIIGNAVAGFGQDVARFAEDQDRIGAIYDTAAVKDADAKAQADLSGIRNSVLTAKGQEAVAAKAEARKKIIDLRKQYVTSMANPRQQRMFGDAFDRLSTQELETYDTHERKEVERYNFDASNARFESNLDRAISLHGANDEASQQALADALTEIPTINRGAAPEVIAAKRAGAVSGFHLGIAQKMLDDDPLAAKKYVDDHASEILEGDEVKLRRSMRDDVEEAEADSAMGELYAGVEGVHASPGPEVAHVEGGEVAKANADPVRGKGGRTVSGGQYGASRAGGRMHAGEDIPAPAGTPVLPPMSGKVEKVWYDKAGGNSILVRHPDGRVTGYAHLRNVNVSAGDTVDASTVLGGVGNTGSASRGNHLHYTVRNGSGNKVDPTKQNWQETLPTYTAERQDKGSLYERARAIATARNMSPRQYQSFLRRIDQDVARTDNLKARSEDEARDAAYEVIDRLGDNFTNVTQIPSAQRARLAPGVLSTLRNVADSNAKGDAVEPGGEAYWGLLEMSGNPNSQSAFLNSDLYKVRGQMSKGEWNSLRKAQIDMKNGGGEQSDVAVDWGRVSTMVGRYAPQAPGVLGTSRKERAQRAKVETDVRSEVTATQGRLGRKLTDDEMGAIARRNITSTYLAPPENTTSARTTTTVSGIPQKEMPALLSALRQMGIPTTAGNVVSLYLRGGGTLQK